MQQQTKAKSGRVGIFGNYLATRISSIQQQMFLLNATTQPGSSVSHPGHSSNPLSTRRASANMSGVAEEQQRLQYDALMHATSASVTNVTAQPTTSATDNAQKNPNSFFFGASNFGSLSDVKTKSLIGP